MTQTVLMLVMLPSLRTVDPKENSTVQWASGLARTDDKQPVSMLVTLPSVWTADPMNTLAMCLTVLLTIMRISLPHL